MSAQSRLKLLLVAAGVANNVLAADTGVITLARGDDGRRCEGGYPALREFGSSAASGDAGVLAALRGID